VARFRSGGRRSRRRRAPRIAQDGLDPAIPALFGTTHAKEGKRRGEQLLTICYIAIMTKLLEQALRQIEHLTEDEQDAAAGALLDYVKHMREVRLTEADIAEVRRRKADPDRKLGLRTELTKPC
jgi:hypothetical protein